MKKAQNIGNLCDAQKLACEAGRDCKYKKSIIDVNISV